MLDRTDFESWQQRICLYCLGKDNGENIMKSITEGPFQMGTFIQTPAEETEGALQLGPERARVFTDLSAEEKEKYKADISATSILLQDSGRDIPGSYVPTRLQLKERFLSNSKERPFIYYVRFITEVKLNRGLKESNFDQLYAYLKQHEVHANENKMMMERFIQPTNDPLALVSNASNQKYPTQSSESPQSSNQPSIVDNCQMDTGSTSTDNLIESLTNTLALLNQSFKAHLPQTNNQLRTSSNARNNATGSRRQSIVLDVQCRYICDNQGNISEDNEEEMLKSDPEQIFWSIDNNVTGKRHIPHCQNALSALTVYPPNTPVKLVPRVLPTKSQVKINLYVLTQLFTEFDKTCKKRITPTGVTEGEIGFEQTKRCYLTEVIPFFKTLKEHFAGVQTALLKEVKVMEEIFDQSQIEVGSEMS
ncbi:hypothetical protein Tco_0733751 [Tanacetum coccineum]